MINQQVKPASVTLAEIKFDNEKLTKVMDQLNEKENNQETPNTPQDPTFVTKNTWT
jgi:hypothetical protein